MSVKNWIRGWRLASLATFLVVCLASGAWAGEVRNVTVSEGPDWVKVNIQGSFDYRVHHLPTGSSGYRSIAVDLSPAHLPSGMEPKAALPVDFGLVGQVRVRPLSSGLVRIYIDVINYPAYEVLRTGNGIQIAVKAFRQRG